VLLTAHARLIRVSILRSTMCMFRYLHTSHYIQATNGRNEKVPIRIELGVELAYSYISKGIKSSEKVGGIDIPIRVELGVELAYPHQKGYRGQRESGRNERVRQTAELGEEFDCEWERGLRRWEGGRGEH